MARALQYEERTGNDLLKFLEEVGKTNVIGLKDLIDLFQALGEGYDVETFDAWDVPFPEKAEKIMLAVGEYLGVKK